MHFSANAADINAGMSLVSHALSARSMRPIYEGVLIETAENGIYLTCTDGEMTIRTRVNAIIVEEGVAVMPAKLFGELTRMLSGEVDIEIDKRFRAEIRAQGSNTSMAGTDASEFPDVTAVKAPELALEMPQRQLKDAISRIMFAVSTDETRRILTGCFIEVFAGETRFVGLDGFRLAMQRIEAENRLPEGKESVSAVVPGRILGEFSRMLGESDEPARIACDRSRFQLTFDETECYTTLLTGEYINYKQILPTSWQSEVKLRRDDFIGAIERASLMAREGKNNLLRLSLNEREMTITANAERGAALERIPVSYSQPEFKIAFNARYLSDVVRNVNTEEMCMRFNSSVSPCTIAPLNGTQYTYLVLPVRVLDS
ncbi:MAG: DNA polymerase III subunit beta [Clostridia bacterium]|nr:DNA polymerase III subunit beta [Clostridia bacterium]